MNSKTEKEMSADESVNKKDCCSFVSNIKNNKGKIKDKQLWLEECNQKVLVFTN